MLSIYARVLMLVSKRFVSLGSLVKFYDALQIQLVHELSLGEVLKLGTECGLTTTQTLLEVGLLKTSGIIRSTSKKVPLKEHSLTKIEEDDLSLSIYCAVVASEPFCSLPLDGIKQLRLVLSAAQNMNIGTSTAISFKFEDDSEVKLMIDVQGDRVETLDTGIVLKKGFPSSSLGRTAMMLAPVPVPSLG